MREILFRGKRIDNGGWVHGSLFPFRNKSCAILPSDSKAFMPKAKGFICCEECYEVDPATVGQYTGLTDKNGVRIFDGDECRVSRPCVLDYGKITFASGCFWFVDSGPGGMLRLCDIKLNGFEIKVIGNIHDNPELREEAPHA